MPVVGMPTMLLRHMLLIITMLLMMVVMLLPKIHVTTAVMGVGDSYMCDSFVVRRGGDGNGGFFCS